MTQTFMGQMIVLVAAGLGLLMGIAAKPRFKKVRARISSHGLDGKAVLPQGRTLRF